ncbi:hypothetical protein CGCS363_v001888 [Colletotrichum siamense]|uniref:uncharacterized protein n=1 Tax=Colletotrichum siamense TaxID=690259 RepID=UPI00187223F9|nr:uncharacterized protein CGCS363_v001888 [Colletotrichum siamense]KAF5516960.1 hypothetical protein CGCS363_v001888 [Colletotrichum siamense]
MKSYTALSVALLVPGLASAAICNNNCGRAVAGTARKDPPFASRSSLCAAFVTAAVQPIIGRNVHVRRQDAPEPVITGIKPAYASSCPDVTAYWSACQCIEGIPATAITVSGTRTTPVTSASVTTILSPSTTVSAEESIVPSSSESSTISDNSETATLEPSTSSEPSISSEPTDATTLEPSRTSDASDTVTQDPTSFITSVPAVSTSTDGLIPATTSISSAPSLPLCTPGLEFAIYTFEPRSPECRGVLYTSPSRAIDLGELLMGRTPDATGLTPGYGTIGLRRSSAQASGPVEYNSVRGPENSTFECNVIQHRGYIEVTAPGTYSVIPETPDDVILIWVGNNARTGQFSASNSNKSGRCCSTPSPYNFTVEPFDGLFEYIPYRIFYANAAGPGGFGVRVAGPGGIIDPFVVANCTGEGNPAPGWSAWQFEDYASN